MMRIGVLIALAVAGLIHATASHAQIVTRQTTPAGLGFRHVHLPEENWQALSFAWKDGTATSLPGKEALPNLAMALIMEGPQGSSRSAMVEELRDLQASVMLGATMDIAQGTLVAPPAKLAGAARLLARTLTDPALSADSLADIARNRAMASRQGESSAEVLARRLLVHMVIEDGPHRRYAAGEAAMFARVSVADIARWRSDVLVRDSVIVVAAGPLPAAAAGREIDRLFAGLPQNGRRPVAAKPVLRAFGKVVVLERPVVQTAIAVGGPMVLPVGADLVRTRLALSALGGGSSGRLWKAVREKLGAAYGISTSLQPFDLDARALLIAAAVANDQAGNVLAAIRGEYAHFLAGGITAEELERLQRTFIASHREGRGRAGSVAGNVLAQALRDLPDDDLATYESRVRGYDLGAVTADVRSAFPKLPLSIVVVAPSAEGLAADCIIKSSAELARCE
jgi:predicted Zn-dependent peptidase